MSEKVYEVKVEEVHSGDDLIGMVDLDVDNLFKRVRLRLRGVDTPSAYKVKADTEAGEVRDIVRELVNTGRCRAVVHSQKRGGWLVTLMVTHRTAVGEVTTNVNDMLIARGYVYKAARDTGQPTYE